MLLSSRSGYLMTAISCCLLLFVSFSSKSQANKDSTIRSGRASLSKERLEGGIENLKEGQENLKSYVEGAIENLKERHDNLKTYVEYVSIIYAVVGTLIGGFLAFLGISNYRDLDGYRKKLRMQYLEAVVDSEKRLAKSLENFESALRADMLKRIGHLDYMTKYYERKLFPREPDKRLNRVDRIEYHQNNMDIFYSVKLGVESLKPDGLKKVELVLKGVVGVEQENLYPKVSNLENDKDKIVINFKEPLVNGSKLDVGIKIKIEKVFGDPSNYWGINQFEILESHSVEIACRKTRLLNSIKMVLQTIENPEPIEIEHYDKEEIDFMVYQFSLPKNEGNVLKYDLDWTFENKE